MTFNSVPCSLRCTELVEVFPVPCYMDTINKRSRGSGHEQVL